MHVQPTGRPELPNYLFSSPKRCPRSHSIPEVAQKPVRPATVLFRRRNDALGAMSTPWSPTSPPELPNCPFSLPVHARAHPEARQQNIALGANPCPAHPEAHQGSQTVHFHLKHSAPLFFSSSSRPSYRDPLFFSSNSRPSYRDPLFFSSFSRPNYRDPLFSSSNSRPKL